MRSKEHISPTSQPGNPKCKGRENSHDLGGLLRKQCHWGAPRFSGTPKKKVKGTLTEKVESRGFASCPSSPRGTSRAQWRREGVEGESR